jgi:type I restriction enzyme S subunit
MLLGETGEYINGFAFKPSHRESEGLPIIRIQNLTNDSKPLNRTNLKVPAEYHILSGDMLVSWSATLDVFIWRKEPALVNQHIFKVVPDIHLIDSRLLFYWLKIAIEQLQATEHLHGSTMKHINRGPFMAHKLPLPPASEQTRIVEKLEELLSDLDAGVAELKAAQKKLVQYRQSLLKAAVEGALTAEWRTSNQPKETGTQLLERILIERRARWEAKQLAKFKEQDKAPPKDWQSKYPEPVKPDTSDLPELPDGWVWASVDCLLAGIETGKSFKCVERSPSFDETGVVKVSAVSWGEYNEQESKTCTIEERVNPDLFVKAGDFLFSRANTVELVGACVIAKTVTLKVMLSDKILRLVLVHDNMKPWLLYLLRSRIGRKQIEVLATGNQESMKNIGQERIRSIAIPIGPEDEIICAIALVEQGLVSATLQISENEFVLKQSAAQRKNILKTAFSGQLVLQDPNDEPASVLLERIRAEREQQKKQPKVKNPRKSTGMKKSNLNNVRDWIECKADASTFNFSELSNDLPGDYETLKDSLFQLLAEDKPIIEQGFDRKTSSLQFKRVKS